jgi:HD-like signal output (HDOD) protein
MKLKEKITGLIRSKRTQLPTLPQVIDNILKVAGDEHSSAKDLAEFIKRDQAISNKILRVANSAYYGLMKEVDSIHRAITIIGFNEVIGMAIGMSVFSSFKSNDRLEVFDMKALWLHSIGSATAAGEILKKTGFKATENIFLSGLMHDIGKVILAVYFPDHYRDVLGEAKRRQLIIHKVERELLGIDHARISGLLMERWNFPDTLLLPTSFHHSPSHCPSDFRNAARTVRLSDTLCQNAGIGNSGNPMVPNVDRLAEGFGFSEQDVETFVSSLKEKQGEFEAFVNAIN